MVGIDRTNNNSDTGNGFLDLHRNTVREEVNKESVMYDAELDGVTFTIVAKSGRSIPYMALCQVGQEIAGKSIFTKYLSYV